MANSPLLKRPKCWLSRDGHRVTGNTPPDPGYIEIEMNRLWAEGLTFWGVPYEREIWLELECMEEEA